MIRSITTILMAALLPSPLMAADATPLADQPIFTTSGVPANVALALSVEFPTAEVLAYYNDTYSPTNEYVGNWDPDKCYQYVDGTANVFSGNNKLFNTAVDDNGQKLSPGDNDPHWSVTNAPAGGSPGQMKKVSTTTAYGDDDSEYLGFGTAGNVPPGKYTYTSDAFTFAAGVDPEDVSVAFELFTDDALVSLSINGVVTGISSSSRWNDSKWVKIPAGSFTQQTNTISLEIENWGQSNNYSGLLIDEMTAYTSGYFQPVATATNRTCSTQATARWSGNFLNHILTHTIDPLKIALAGGYRSVDTASQTILDKGWSTMQYYPD